jgi:hypothetical protein
MLLGSFDATMAMAFNCVRVLSGLHTTFILNLSENVVGLDVRAIGKVKDYKEGSGLNIWKFGLSA